jgi:hypothetical protein
MAVTLNASTTAGLELTPDTSGVLNLQSGGTTVVAVTSTGASVTGLLEGSTNYTGFKNRIINGAMVIDQRNAGASVTVNDNEPYTVDRWQAQDSTDGAFTAQQNAGSVTPPNGFTNYLGVTITTADSSLSASQFARLQQCIEGFNFADLAWGTANASTVTLSFWVRSSLTGTFGGAVQNGTNNRSYPFSYTITSANTWELKSVTIAGDTTGTWATTNGRALFLQFGLGVGSTYSGTAGAWAGANYVSATGATSVVGTNGATFYITGVQLEKGSTATSFDYRPYGTELALCQRYLFAYRRTGNDPVSVGLTFSPTAAGFIFPLPVAPRVPPTGAVVSNASDFYVVNPSASNAFTCSTLVFGAGTNITAALNATFSNNGGAAGQANILHSNTAGAYFYFTGSEL